MSNLYGFGVIMDIFHSQTFLPVFQQHVPIQLDGFNLLHCCFVVGRLISEGRTSGPKAENTVFKQEINLFQGQALGLWNYHPDEWYGQCGAGFKDKVCPKENVRDHV